MRVVLVGAVLLAVLLLDAERGADAAPWCARYDDWTQNCGFYTYQQCLAAVSGVGGYCQPNPQEPPRRYRR